MRYIAVLWFTELLALLWTAFAMAMGEPSSSESGELAARDYLLGQLEAKQRMICGETVTAHWNYHTDANDANRLNLVRILIF